jgi:hypothetical protein
VSDFADEFTQFAELSPEEIARMDALAQAADERIEKIKQEIREYLWDWDLPTGYAFNPEYGDLALHFIAQYVEQKLRGER